MPAKQATNAEIEIRLSRIEGSLHGIKSNLAFLLLMVTMIMALLLGALIKFYFG